MLCTNQALLLLRRHRKFPRVYRFRFIVRHLCDKKNLEPLSNGPASQSTSTQATTDDGATKPPASTFSSYTQAINHSIGDIEKVLMARIHESNQRRFRIMFFSTVGFIIFFFVIFGEKISKKLKSLTTGLALETLEDKSIKIQTQELAMAVVQTILNDKDVTAHAASFLREAAQTPETQEALLKLTLHVLQHADSLKELTRLTTEVLEELSRDEVCGGGRGRGAGRDIICELYSPTRTLCTIIIIIIIVVVVTIIIVNIIIVNNIIV